MKKIIITIALLCASLAYAGTRYETENFVFSNSVTAKQFLGDHIDILAPTTATNAPEAGKVRLYGQTVNGQEALYYKQSDNTLYRICRDSVITVYNAEEDTLLVGEAVYATDQMYGNTAHQVKRAKADSATTMPAIGLVTESDGIPTGETGTILCFGRTPTTIDTTGYSGSGAELFVSPTVAGGLTETEPSIPYYSQLVGFVGYKNASGTITVRSFKPTQVNRPAFVASIIGVNTYAGNTTNIVYCSNLVHSVGFGSTQYNTNNGTWTPPQGNCEMGASLRCRTQVGAARYVRLYLFKNGAPFADLWDYTTVENEFPLMNPVYYFYNDASTNAYTLRFRPEQNNTFSVGTGEGNARWWGRYVE